MSSSPLAQFKSAQNLAYISSEVDMDMDEIKMKIPGFLATDTRFSDEVYMSELTLQKNGFWKAVKELNINFIYFLQNPPDTHVFEDYNIYDLLAGSDLAKSLNVDIYSSSSSNIRMKTDPNMRLERREKIPFWQIVNKKTGIDQKPMHSSMLDGMENRMPTKNLYSR